jgi:hypothetical protein
MIPKQAVPLSEAVQNHPDLAELTRRIELLTQVQQVLDSQWRSMELAILSIRDGVANINTANASIATKARQMAPSILAAIQRVNSTIAEVRFKPVKTGSNAAPQPKATINREISNDALEHLQMAASQLDAGPTRAALQRLINRHLGD